MFIACALVHVRLAEYGAEVTELRRYVRSRRLRGVWTARCDGQSTPEELLHLKSLATILVICLGR
jgi:hypothetical protein